MKIKPAKPGTRKRRPESQLVQHLRAELRECHGSIAMLAGQLADKREIIRRLVS